jgi:predicted DNA-binding transcriptional regulator YafY
LRADRLLSILLLLQTKGRMTAQALAKRLEVSERTVYRDLEALGKAGVPVYAERGPGGGWALLEGYRTNLTRLTETEARTLFMSGVAGPMADLGLGKALEGAMLKLLAALPSAYRHDAEQARQRMHLDSVGWSSVGETVPHLQAIQDAVWNSRKVCLLYRRGDGTLRERVVDPLGLVSKANIWYLVGAVSGELRVYRVSRIRACTITEEPCQRPATFDLPTFWADWCDQFQANFSRYPVIVRVAPDCIPVLSRVFGEGIYALAEQAGPPGADGWMTLLLTFETLESARGILLGFGTLVEVLEPRELRESIADLAVRVATFYRKQMRIS